MVVLELMLGILIGPHVLEIAHVDEGRKVITHIIQTLEDVSKVEAAPSHQGRRIICTLAPK